MMVGIGSVEVTDEVRKALRKDMGMSGLASRADAKKFILDAIEVAFEGLLNPKAPVSEVSEEDAANAAHAEEAQHAPTAPPAADELPEPPAPPAPGTTTAYTGSAYYPPPGAVS